MNESANLWMIFKRNMTANFDYNTIGASIFKYDKNNKLVVGYLYNAYS
ncbi:hypothetical protein SH1V18_19960 [Vallitalea longa]|uniref:Uncharacterized protein n=1 Tax=Vallitalea longa TaxID=2936439 RepID=A0A9W5YBM7_9FIRM|nr:hypothetical protein [Vallitalea longa]GKX29516.1 hypothetical protein SH1V18_19960 [Vallitalea longa]